MKFAFRQLSKTPGFSCVAVLTLALGIGANTAIFTLANAVLFRPAPFPDPEGVYYLHTRNPLNELHGVSGLDFTDWQNQSRVFSRMAAYRAGEFSLKTDENASVVSGVTVSKGFLDVFRVHPLQGRSFTDEEFADPNSHVVMIGEKLWKRSFQRDPSAVGRTIRLDGEDYTIIGVLPRAAASLGDYWEGIVTPDICLPMNLRDPQLQNRDQRSLSVIARLKPGMTQEQAESEAKVISDHLAAEYPAANKGHFLLVNRWDQERQGAWKSWLFFMALVGCVLLIACANVANLLLARSLTRTKEIGIRTALGASRLQIVKQLLAESLLLALTGGALGILLSRWGVQMLAARMPASFFSTDPATVEFTIDWRVLLFLLAVSVISTLLFGLIPALQASRVDVNRALQEGNQGAAGSPRQRRISRSLVAAEVAIALVLLTGAVTMLDAFLYLFHKRTHPDFETAHLAYARLAMLGPKYESPERRSDLVKLLMERLKGTPGIESVTAGSNLPGTWPLSVRPYAVDRPPVSSGDTVGASLVQADPGYFQMFNISTLKGRLFNDHDRAGSPPVAIINERLAARLFRSKNPLGQHITWPGLGPTPCEVVGVVRYEADAYPAYIFVPIAQRCGVYPTVIIKTASNPGPFLANLREALQTVDPDQPIDGISTMDTMLRTTGLGTERAMLLMIESFAGPGFLLAIVGVGSIVAYAASQRIREIGIRLALGATRGQILTLMLREAMVPVAIGLGIGLIVSTWLQRVLWTQGSFAPGWEPNTPLLFTIVVAAFGLVAMLAGAFPAHRATRVNPIVTLRYE